MTKNVTLFQKLIFKFYGTLTNKLKKKNARSTNHFNIDDNLRRETGVNII